MKTFLLSVVSVGSCAISSFSQNNDGTIHDPSPIPSTEFIAYHKTEGEQPIVIGDSEGRALLKEYALPVYFGYPTRSYRIVGAVITHGSTRSEEELPRARVLRSIVAAAKLHGAEAVIMLRLTDEDRLKVRPNGEPWIVAKAIAVRWRRPNDS